MYITLAESSQRCFIARHESNQIRAQHRQQLSELSEIQPPRTSLDISRLPWPARFPQGKRLALHHRLISHPRHIWPLYIIPPDQTSKPFESPNQGQQHSTPPQYSRPPSYTPPPSTPSLFSQHTRRFPMPQIAVSRDPKHISDPVGVLNPDPMPANPFSCLSSRSNITRRRVMNSFRDRIELLPSDS